MPLLLGPDGGLPGRLLAAGAGESTSLTRRTVLAGGVGIVGVALTGAPVASAAPGVDGRIAQVYLAAGGDAVLGAPVAREVAQRIDHHHTYGQRFERGQVWWGSAVGLVDRPGARVRLPSGPNFRPVTGLRDVWRSDDLDGCSALEKRVVADLGITTMIAMNSGGDPAIPGVRRYRYRVGNAGDPPTFYAGYVTQAVNRAAIGRVVRRIARSHAPVLVHCQAGKDRTGWVCDLLQAVAGVDPEVRDLEYLATRAYSGAPVELDWLDTARDRLDHDYGTVGNYLVDGCGLARRDLRRLAARLG